MKIQLHNSATATSRKKKVNAAKETTNFLTQKNQTMGQEKKITDEVAISLSKETATVSISANDKQSKKMENIMKQVKEECAGAIRFDGFDDCILGRDYSTNSIVYDGYAIINKMAKENMEEDKMNGELDGEYEDYYDNAEDVLSYTMIRGLSYIPDNSDTPKPIVYMQFFEEI